MDDTPALTVLLTLLLPSAVLAAWGVRAAWRGVGLLRAGVGARQRGFHTLQTESVALRGKIVSIQPLKAPETGRQCVYVSHTVDRWDKSATMGGFPGQWIRMAASEEAAPFEISDGRCSVLVEPEGGRFHVPHTETGQRPQEDGSMIRFTEQTIQEGDEVLVVGQALQRGGFEPSEAYRGHNYRTVICRGEGDLLVIKPPLAMMKRTLAQVVWSALAVLPLAIILMMVVSLLQWSTCPPSHSWLF